MRRPLSALLLLLLSALLLPGRSLADDTDLGKRVKELLGQLGSDQLDTRKKASADLRDLPAEAVPLLEAALKDKALELGVRLRIEHEIGFVRHKIRTQAITKRFQKIMIEGYRKNGRKDPAWDDTVIEAFQLMATAWGNAYEREDNEFDRILDLCRKAEEAGCDDPLVAYVHGWTASHLKGDVKEIDALYQSAAKGIKATGYHPSHKVYIYAETALQRENMLGNRGAWNQSDLDEVQKWIDEAIELLPDMAREKDIPYRELIVVSQTLIDVQRALSGDRKTAFDKVHSILKKAMPDHPVPLLIEGDFWSSYAWDARGAGGAGQVTKNGWQLFRDRLNRSEQALTRAYELAPDDGTGPTKMIAVCMGLQKPREEMEKWFAQAMEADPDNVEACRAKSLYLEPKWGGSAEKTLEFARECLATENWGGNIPFLLPETHVVLAFYHGADYAGVFDPKYLKDPEVWKDFETVYEGYLKRYPNSYVRRSKYAYYACLAEKWSVAHEQIEKLGDHIHWWVFGTKEEFKLAKNRAARKGAPKKQ